MRRTEEQKAEIRELLEKLKNDNLLSGEFDRNFDYILRLNNLNPFEVKVGEFVSLRDCYKHVGKVVALDDNTYRYDGMKVNGVWVENDWFYTRNVIPATDEQIKLWHVENDKRNKPKLEVGKWYKRNGYLMCFQSEDTHQRNSFKTTGYGFDSDGWRDKMWFNCPEDFTEATHQEVETALINEAKRRGFKEGVRFISAMENRDIECDALSNNFKYHADKAHWGLTISGSNGASIFVKGKWATIISTKEITVEELKELGYTIKIEKV